MPAATFPLSVHSSGRYLVDALGVPFFIHGEDAASLAVAIAASDVSVYLDDRVTRGVNSIWVQAIETHFSPNAPNNFANDSPFTGTTGGVADITTPREVYWAHVDDVINAAATRGMCVFLNATYLGFNGSAAEGWYTTFVTNGSTNCTTYGNFLGNRYKNFPNIVWLNGGDYNPASKTEIDAIINAIKAADTNHIHTSHQNGLTSGFTEWNSDGWLNLNDIYIDPVLHPSNSVIAGGLTEYQRSPPQPFYLVESCYEREHSATLQTIRQEAWEAVLSGGTGWLFGNNPMWGFMTGPNPLSSANNGTEAQKYDGTDSWKNHLSDAGIVHATRWAALFMARAWWKLIPDTANRMLTAGQSSDPTRRSASLASDGTWGLVYIPGSAAGSVTIDRSVFADRIVASWYDPTNAVLSPVSGSPFTNTGSFTVSTPGNNAAGDGDWVLLCETDAGSRKISKWMPAQSSSVRR
jgi:hypothetical protein